MKRVSLLLLILHALGIAASASFEVDGRNPSFPFNWIAISDGAGVNQVTNFGSVDLGAHRDRRFRFKNNHSSAFYSWTGSSGGNSQFQILNSSGNAMGYPVLIAPGGDREFIIRYTPTTTSVSATIRLDNNAPGSVSPYTFNVIGSGLIPDARISGKSSTNADFDNILDGETTPRTSEGTDFGFIPVGSPVVRYFKLTNDGNTPLNPGSYHFLGTFGSSFQVNGLSLSNLGAENSREFTITFTPTVPEVIEATFELVSDDPDENPYSFKVRGEGVAYPEIRVRGLQGAIPTTIEDGDHTPDQQVTKYGDVSLGEAGTRTFRIVNDGIATLTIDSIVSSSSRYTIPGPPTSVPANDHRDFVINFTPNSMGPVQTRITIRSNVPGNKDPYTFDLTGSGVGPEIAIEGFGTAGELKLIPDGTTALSTSNGTEFGNVNVSGGKATHNFIVHNTGSKNLRINKASFMDSGASHFSVAELFAGNPFADIGPEASRTFTITFNPSSAGSKLATFSIENNDADEDPYTFRVRGFGVAEPDIRVRGLTKTSIPFDIKDGDTNPDDQDVTQYGAVNPGTTATRLFRIVNDGDVTLTIQSITSSSASYTIPGPPTSISPNDSTDFVIDFKPTTIGRDQTLITVESNDPDGEGTYTFALVGSGDGPEIVVNSLNRVGQPEIMSGQTATSFEDSTHFGSYNMGTQPRSIRHYRVTNIGTKNLRIQSRTFTGSGADHFKVSGLLAGNPFANLSPLESRDFSIEFDPSSVGSKLATFSMETTDGDEDPFTFRVQGVAVSEPRISLKGRAGGTFTGWHIIHHGDTLPNAENGTQFGAMAVTGKSIKRNFEITNFGPAPLTIASIRCNRRDFQIDGAPRVVGAGATATFDIVFDPVETGALDGTITITSDAENYPEFEFAITGYSWDNIGPRLQVEGHGYTLHQGDGSFIGELFDIWYPISHNDANTRKNNGTDFGTIDLDGSEGNWPFDRSRGRYNGSRIRLINAGATPLTIYSATVSSRQYNFYSDLDEQPSIIVPAGGCLVLWLDFRPWTYGRHDAQLTIESDSLMGSPFVIQLTGFADSSDGPELYVEEPEDAMRALPGQSITEAIPIHNVGNEILTLGNWNLEGSSQFTLESAPLVLGPGQEDEILVTYAAPASGAIRDEAVITFATNDPDDGEFAASVSIFGEPGQPSLLVRTGSTGGWHDDIANGSTTIFEDGEFGTDFGSNAPDGTPTVHSFTLLNDTSIGTLNLRGIAISSPSFQVQGAPTTLEPGEEGPLLISYLPVGGGTETATVTILSDDPDDDPYQFAIQGTSTGATPAPDIIDFWQIGDTSNAGLTFESYPGKQYRIRWSSHPSSGWSTPADLFGIEGTGYRITETIPNAFLSDRLFFRVEEH